jgi:hypothetical protein
MRRRIPRKVATTVVVMGGLMLVGCGGSQRSSVSPTIAQTPTSAAVATPLLTPTLSSGAATALALGPDVALIDYQDPAGRYSVQLPSGWERVESPGLDQVFLRSPDLATLTITCVPGESASSMAQTDQNINANSHGDAPTLDVDNQVAGIPGRRVVWINRVFSRDMLHTAEYFEGKGCAWRAQLVTPVGLDFARLFERVLASFKFNP